MTSFTAITKQFEDIASNAAHDLAELSIRNKELRQAMETVRLGDDAVRIGDFDIVAQNNLDYRTYNIRCKRNGKIIASELPFYETARYIVQSLNEGAIISGAFISRIIADSQLYHRLRTDVEQHKLRAVFYRERGLDERADLHEAKLSCVATRLAILQADLIEISPYR